jgi:hypothetical protein
MFMQLGKIQATAKKSLVEKIKRTMYEGEVYEIENMLEVLKHMKHFCSTQTKILQKITYKYALY